MIFVSSSLYKIHYNTIQYLNHSKEAETVEQIYNACNKKFTSNDQLEVHMTAEHEDEADCSKCKASFKKEANVYKHAEE